MTATNRDVIYTIKVVADPGNNRIVENLLAVEKQVQEAARKTEQVKVKARNDEEKAAQKAAQEQERLQSRVFQNRVKLLARIQKEEEKSAKEQERIQAKLAKDKERQILAGQRLAEKAAKEEQRQLTVLAKAQEAAAKQEEQRQAKVFQNRVKMLERIRVDREKAEQDAARAHEQSVGQMTASQEKLKGSIMAGTEGLIRMGRGAAMLGVVGEKDAKKLLDALVKIQAAYDIAKGAVDFYWHITEAVKAYRTAVLAAAAAEQALGAARGKSAAMGGVSAAGGAAGGLGAFGGAAAGATALAGTAAVAGVGAAGYAAYDIGSGNWRDEGSYTQTMAGFYESIAKATAGLAGMEGPAFDAAKNADLLALATKSAAAEQMAAERTVKVFEASMRDAARGSLAMFRSDRMLRQVGGGDPSLMAAATLRAGSELSARQSEVSHSLGSNGVSDEDALRLSEEAARLAEKQVSLTEQRMGFEKEAAEIGIRAAREKISAAERERSIAADIVQKEKERNMTVLERFGQMSRAEQQQLLAVRQKADRFGADALSQQERAKLRSIGTASAERLAREGDVAAATAAGGTGLFRAEDYAAQRAAEQRVVQAEVVIADQRKVEVQIEANTDALVAQIQGMLSNQYDDWEAAVEAQLQRAVSVELSRQRNRINQERIAAQQSR